MKLQVWTALAAGALLTASAANMAGCSSSSSAGSSSSGTSSSGTSSSGGGGSGGTPTTVSGATAYTGSDVTCDTGDAWEVPAGAAAPDADPSAGLACSVDPTTDPSNGDDVYCCIDWTSDSSSCAEDPDLTSDCQDACAQDTSNPCQPVDVLGFQCDATTGDTPESLDSSLTCSADPNGTGAFCCE